MRVEGQMEPCTRLRCEQCLEEFQAMNRNGVAARFCSDECRTSWHNGQKLSGAALLKRRRANPKRAPRRKPRTLDELSASLGLPPGCYPAGAVARLVGAPSPDKLSDLLDAARRLGLTEEGPILTAARAAAAATKER